MRVLIFAVAAALLLGITIDKATDWLADHQISVEEADADTTG